MMLKKNVIALVYDFDGTLTPEPMQEYTVLPKLKVKPSRFWKEVHQEARKTGSDELLTYMRLLLKYAKSQEKLFTKEEFKKIAAKIEYFDGVETWFGRINRYVRKIGRRKCKIRHYVISSGMMEILKGIKIRKHFARVYASQYYFEYNLVPVFPKILITGTEKTQYLFRINKGLEDLKQNVNEHMPEIKRPIPFSQMIYVGDGMTDVPCMAVMKKNGGHAIAVYKPNTPNAKRKCLKLLEAGRVDFIAPADYRRGQELERKIRLLLDAIMAAINCRRELEA